MEKSISLSKRKPFKKAVSLTLALVIVFCFMSALTVVTVSAAAEGTEDFKVVTDFSPSTLVPNQMLTAKVTATNISTVPFSGKTDVLVIVGLYDVNNTMVNVSYISKGIAYQGTEVLSAGFKLPSNITGYTARAFMWDGTDLKTTNMIPISNAVQIPETGTTALPTVVPTQTIRPTTTPTPTQSIRPTTTPTPTIIRPTMTPVTTTPLTQPVYRDVSVHDPSVLKTNGTYFIIGSHLASAKTNDLMSWTSVSNGVSNSNPLIPNVYTELKETFDWAQTSTLWAGDIIQLKDGKYYMYYCGCKGDSPLSTLGVAVSNNVAGPYKDLGIIFKSGKGTGADGTPYDGTKNPNAVDPDAFYDKNGNFWMVYGSYSGGIYIVKMDPATAKPIPGQGWGKKLLGGNHSRIEGPFMLYSPESDYYYLFLSFGGLTADGGYNMRVVRSKNPDGPFVDASGKNMIDCHGPVGSFFDDRAIEPYGTKIMGNFNFVDSGIGYASPGHNSAYYDEPINKYYLIFHTRFPGQGENFQDRVHQMFINEDGWPVVAPHRYAGETIGRYTPDQVSGNYAYINHGTDISAAVKNSVRISLNRDGTISGSVNGKWELKGDHDINLTIGGVTYAGVVLQCWDNGLKKPVMTFTALAKNSNVSIWGSRVN